MTQSATPTPVPTTAPTLECDVVMKGGITSGVVYPRALAEFATTYRLRNLGGASAGGIGSALGAAAEFGRATGGFDTLAALPAELGEGRLAALFAPQPVTRPLLGVMLALTGQDRPGPARHGAARVMGVLGALWRGYPLTFLLGLLPGLALLVWAFVAGGAAGIGLALCGILLAAVGFAAAVAVRLARQLSMDVPANLFGICRGLGTPQAPALTDWLSEKIDAIAGLAPEHRPLRFGQLWTGTTTPELVRRGPDRVIDLQMISTCLSQGRPYQMPWEAGGFFFEPEVWATLFPPEVMRALLAAPLPTGPLDTAWQDELAATHSPALRRLPSPEHLPVIVATRMTLSFPLLISAVPLWTIDWRATRARETAQRRAADPEAAERSLVFAQVWFTDGGMCSNFPIHLFDSALPTRPTFAINLGSFSQGEQPSSDQSRNIDYATSNSEGILPSITPVPASGFAALAGFASAAFNTARSWADETQLSLPGFRDRIVRVKQTRAEGGMNLFMDATTIDTLAERGRAAARAMIDQFTQPRYPARTPTATGWENHQWVRYRALLASLPEWLDSYARGRAVQEFGDSPPSYAMTRPVKRLADDLAGSLDGSAAVVAGGPDEDTAEHRKALAGLVSEPAPAGVIRRTPMI